MMPLPLLLALLLGVETRGDGAAAPRRILRCEPYAEVCPACVDCSRCRACSVLGSMCSVRAARDAGNRTKR